MPHIDEYVTELLRLEGRGGHGLDKCNRCREGKAAVRCLDCFSVDLYCTACVLDMHALNPLHRLEVKLSPILPEFRWLTKKISELEWHIFRINHT